MMLFSTPVMCAAPATCPAMIKELFMFFSVMPANDAPCSVGIDISTMLLVRLVRELEDVAWEAEEGKMIWRPVWSDIDTFEACEKLGLRIGPPGCFAISSL
jgi:hypothetical protein